MRDTLRTAARKGMVERAQQMAKELSAALGLPPERPGQHGQRSAAELAAQRADGIFITAEAFLVCVQRMHQLENELHALTKARVDPAAGAASEEEGAALLVVGGGAAREAIHA